MAMDSGGADESSAGGGFFDQLSGWIQAGADVVNAVSDFANKASNAVNEGAAAVNNIVDAIGDVSTFAGQVFGVGEVIDNAMHGQMSCVVGGVPLSIVTVETPTWTGKPSRYALEDGEPGEDHFQRNPLVIKLTGMLVSDHLLHRLYYEALKQMHIKRKLIPYVSGMEVRGNMMITQLAPSLKAGTANGYYVTMTLEQIHIAKAGKSESQGNDPATGTAPEGDTTDGGDQSAGNEEPQDGSVLWRIWDWVSGK
jgi:hypothetical protein